MFFLNVLLLIVAYNLTTSHFLVCFFQILTSKPFFTDTDDLAQYLDQLLTAAVPQRGLRVEAQAKGLSRFKAAATKTCEMVSLMNKAKDLQIHSELTQYQLLCTNWNLTCWRVIFRDATTNWSTMNYNVVVYFYFLLLNHCSSKKASMGGCYI